MKRHTAPVVVCCLLVAPLALGDAGLTSWEPLGPGTTGAIVRTIWIDPADGDRILVGSPGGGIWRTADGGATWSFRTPSAPSQVVTGIASSVAAPDILYAGTGESFAAFRGAPGAGMLKSLDRGETWTPIASTAAWELNDNRFVNGIAVHPTAPDVVLVATDEGIQYTNDGGVNWSLRYAGRVTDVHFVDDQGRAVAGLEPNGSQREAVAPPTVVDDLECALYSTTNGLFWNIATFQFPAVNDSRWTTTLCSDTSAGDLHLYVESGAPFESRDYIRVGYSGNQEVLQVHSTAQQCDCCYGGGGRSGGCNDENCQTKVCDPANGGNAFCCSVEWTAACDALAEQLCTCCTTDGTCTDQMDVVTLRRHDDFANLLPNGGQVLNSHFDDDQVELMVGLRTKLRVDPFNQRVYASMGAGGGTVWLSDDFGQTYDFISNPPSNELVDRPGYAHEIWAVPDPLGGNDDVVVVGGDESSRSVNGGVDFLKISMGSRFYKSESAHIDHHAIVAHPGFPATPSVYFGTDGGIQRADDIMTVGETSGWTNLACVDDFVQTRTTSGSAGSVCPPPMSGPGSGLGLGQFWCGATTADGQWLLGSAQDIDAVFRRPNEGINDWYFGEGSGDARGCVIVEDGLGDIAMFSLVDHDIEKMNECEAETINPPPLCLADADCPNNNNCTGGICRCVDEDQTNLRSYQCESSTIDPPDFCLSNADCPNNNACTNQICDCEEVEAASERFLWAITSDPDDWNRLAVGGRALFHTTNQGAEWKAIRKKEPLNAYDRDVLASSIAIAEGDQDKLWAGYENGTLVRTQNSSLVDWLDVSPTVNASCAPIANKCSVADIAIDPDNHDIVYIALAGFGYDFRYNCCESTVLKTSDEGMGWTPMMGTAPTDLPATAAYSITMHPEDPSWLYVGTDRGIFASEDGGATWSRTPIKKPIASEGPESVIVTELSWHDPDYLVATTYGLGMHRIRAPRTLYVDWTWAGQELGTQPKPFDTVQEAVSLSGQGTTISIAGGTYNEGEISFTKRGRVVATGSDARID